MKRAVRRAIALAALGSAGGALLERAVRQRADALREAGRLGVIRGSVRVGAPIERTWAELADVPGQVRWMAELKAVRIETPGPIRVGTRAVGLVRIFGVPVWDPVEIVGWDPPRRFAIRHTGLFAGGGIITLEAIDASTTLVRWDETLRPPVFPHLGELIARPILSRIFQADLETFARLVEGESGSAGDPGEPDGDPGEPPETA
ncbi:MAG: SRPBCC family protein [Chloroflexi bacterium]|nr:SRPBCC family protein [Chloroflexota bacterium]